MGTEDPESNDCRNAPFLSNQNDFRSARRGVMALESDHSGARYLEVLETLDEFDNKR